MPYGRDYKLDTRKPGGLPERPKYYFKQPPPLPVITPNTSIKRTITTNTANIVTNLEVTDLNICPKVRTRVGKIYVPPNLNNIKQMDFYSTPLADIEKVS